MQLPYFIYGIKFTNVDSLVKGSRYDGAVVFLWDQKYKKYVSLNLFNATHYFY